MTTAVRKWGHSLAVRIPKALVQTAGLHEASPVQIEVEGDRLIVTPLVRRAYRLVDLVRAISRKNRHPAVESGPARGREMW